jgi:hypothetical protein
MAAISSELNAKRLEFLKMTIPQPRSVAVIWSAAEPNAGAFPKEAEKAARVLGMKVQSLEVRAPEELAGILQVAHKEGANALTVLRTPLHFGTGANWRNWRRSTTFRRFTVSDCLWKPAALCPMGRAIATYTGKLLYSWIEC